MLWVLPSSGSVLGQQALEWTFQYLLHTLWSWLQLPRGAKVETDGAACGLLRERSRPISFRPWFGSVLPSPPSVSSRVNSWDHLPGLSGSWTLHPNAEALHLWIPPIPRASQVCTGVWIRHPRTCTFPVFSRPPAELMGLCSCWTPLVGAVNSDRWVRLPPRVRLSLTMGLKQTL